VVVVVIDRTSKLMDILGSRGDSSCHEQDPTKKVAAVQRWFFPSQFYCGTSSNAVNRA